MRTYEKTTINDKVVFENDTVHFKMDGDTDYKLGRVVFYVNYWKIVDIGAKKAMRMSVAETYGLIIYKE